MIVRAESRDQCAMPLGALGIIQIGVDQRQIEVGGKVLRVLGQDKKFSLCFLQEYVDSMPLEELGRKIGRIPQSVLEAGDAIAQAAEEAGIDGIEKLMQKARVREVNGDWMPVLTDFKHVAKPTESKRSLFSLFRKGKSAKSGGFAQRWRELSAQLEKSGT